MNCLPAERPRSITSQACGLADGFTEAETLTTGAGFRVANCGCCKAPDVALLPCDSGLGAEIPEGLERALGLSGAPHSSQYCDPSRFSVLHLSHVIIRFQAWLCADSFNKLAHAYALANLDFSAKIAGAPIILLRFIGKTAHVDQIPTNKSRAAFIRYVSG